MGRWMMDRYLTGATIKALREKRGMTQAQLADKLNVSGKAVSKWETGAGYPDITLLEPIAAALRTSVSELLAGVSPVEAFTAGLAAACASCLTQYAAEFDRAEALRIKNEMRIDPATPCTT